MSTGRGKPEELGRSGVTSAIRQSSGWLRIWDPLNRESVLRRGIFGAVVEVSTTPEVFVTSVGFVVGVNDDVGSDVDCEEHPRSMRGNKANSGRFINAEPISSQIYTISVLILQVVAARLAHGLAASESLFPTPS